MQRREVKVPDQVKDLTEDVFISLYICLKQRIAKELRLKGSCIVKYK